VHLHAGQPRQFDPADAAQPVELGEEGAQRVAPVDVVRAVRREDDQPRGVHRSVEIAEEFAGGAVRPVQVLQGDDDRTAGGQPFQQLCRQFEEAGAAVLLVVRLGAGGPGAAGRGRQIGQQTRQLRLPARCGGGHLRLSEGAVQAAQGGGEGRERQPVRAQFEAASDCRGGSGRARGAQELLQQPALAHARLAGQQQRLRLARVGAGERIGEQNQLVAAADEDGADGGVAGHVVQHGTGHRHRVSCLPHRRTA
jgi:hypothetical protein